MSDGLDPELAALMGIASSAPPRQEESASGKPDFHSLFGEMDAEGQKKDHGEFGVDLSRTRISEPARYELDSPIDYFSDPEYYKKALNGEGEEAQKLHELLSKYLKAADPKDRGIFRQQLIPAFWYLASKLALRVVSKDAAISKRLTLRFGALLPNLLSPEMRTMIGKIVFEKELDEPIYYADEWIRSVALGQIKASATDEVKAQRGDDGAKLNAMLEKAQGKRDAAEGIMKAKAEERKSLEAGLLAKVQEITERRSEPGLLQIPSPYTDAQRRASSEILEFLRKLGATDRALAQSIDEFKRASEDLESAKEKAEGTQAEANADLKSVAQEFETIRQMVKLCVGRQGNHFPLLSKEYFHGGAGDMGTRENVAKSMAWLESIEPEAFTRTYKNTLNRIVPFVILLPCYGDLGVCWEPFDKFNRASSRGRIALPLFPKNLQVAVVTAIADLRWQVAKEKASYYWMEEGLTGNYYQWFTSKKIKGDVKEFFIQDYILWITKESEGTQKLDKEVRGIFWRYLPFSQPIKEKLKTRSYIYQELYQRDVNRSLSDGY